LSEDERLFRDSVYEFANARSGLSRDMDERAKMPQSLIDKLFASGDEHRDEMLSGRGVVSSTIEPACAGAGRCTPCDLKTRLEAC